MVVIFNNKNKFYYFKIGKCSQWIKNTNVKFILGGGRAKTEEKSTCSGGSGCN